MFAGCNKDGNNEPTPTANGGGSNGGTNGGGQTAGEWVDLGLPSGLLWATCNVGATTPEDYGDYYAWGETTTKEVYDWSTYKWCRGDYNQLTKYCSNSSYGHHGYTDGLTTLEAFDDAAAQALGSGARMPTFDEWMELIRNTTAEWTTMNGVNGCKITAANGKSLFLPAAGGHDGSELGDAGKRGYYWSSSLRVDKQSCAWLFDFSSIDQFMVRHDRYYGQSVRPVRSAF
jgi:uncharacterized protein (TIGR02145 family)